MSAFWASRALNEGNCENLGCILFVVVTVLLQLAEDTIKEDTTLGLAYLLALPKVSSRDSLKVHLDGGKSRTCRPHVGGWWHTKMCDQCSAYSLQTDVML